MYAVIDLETTGLRPSWHDRVIEIAVVHVDASGGVEDEWCTLVNPRRDLGPQDVHGIRSAEVLGAPTFESIAGRLAQLLAGRSPVAHNFRFDGMFLQAEYKRLGVDVPLQPHYGLCTMQLASRYLPHAGRGLSDCCAAADIDVNRAHSALHDARAAAALLAYYLRRAGQPPPWAQSCAAAVHAPWPDLPVRPVAQVARRAPGAVTDHFLARLVARLPRVNSDDADSYLELLDRALLDRHISATEAQGLIDFAHSLGLGGEQVVALHERYLEALAVAALADEVLTEIEYDDLRQVTALLGLDNHDLDEALGRAREADAPSDPGLGQFTLAPGDRVVFTGQLDEPREVWEERATDAGLVPTASVTRRTKLVVAADPDTQSGKASTARRYGIPLVDPETFIRLAQGAGATGEVRGSLRVRRR